MAEKKSKKSTTKKTAKTKQIAKKATETTKAKKTVKAKSSAKQIVKKASVKKTVKAKSSAKQTVKKASAKKSEKLKTAVSSDQNKKKAPARRKRKTASKIVGPSAEESKQWEKLAKQYERKRVPSYDMKKTYNDISVIKHNSFGLGFILAKYNNRLRVLFKEGTKTLVSNYQN